MADNAAPSPEGQEPDDPRDAQPWIKLIEQAEGVFDRWQTCCDNLAKEYANVANLAAGGGDREFQMLYANLEVVKPAMYSRPPQPVVVQRFKDPGKAVERKTGEILERALTTSFDTEKVHPTLKRVRDDLALCGRGVIWLRYETYTKGGEIKECVRHEWLHRRDFVHEPARIWSEVGWVARGAWLTKEQGEKRFNPKDENGDPVKGADGLPIIRWKDITYTDAKDTSENYNVEQKARVWEIWHKASGQVIWIHPNSKEVLDQKPPELNIDGFFPCPQPAYATCEPDSLVPVPDPVFYKDQLEEINELTARISSLSESLKLIGFYAAGVEDLGAAIEAAMEQVNSGENRRVAIPLPGMNSFQGGALKDAIVWLPVVEVANTVKELVALRRQLIDDVYQISGISDIMRGDTEASETLGAQQLKSQYGSLRIKDRQAEMVRIADDTLNIGGEIMAENFTSLTLMSMSQVDLPRQADVLAQHQQAMAQEIQAAAQQALQSGQPIDPAQAEQARQAIILKHQEKANEVVTVEKVFALLRAERLRPFILQIATDSTIQPDENAEKAARNEFAASFGQLVTGLTPLMQLAPAEASELGGEMIKFVMEPYRAGRPMQQAVEDFVEKMKAKAQQPPPPSPEMMKAEGEAKRLEMETATKAAELEDRKAERAEKQRQSMIDAASKAEEAKAKQTQTGIDAMVRQAEAQAKLAEIDRKAQADAAAQAHAERIQLGEIRLQQLQIELAELKLKEAREKPKATANGEAHAN